MDKKVLKETTHKAVKLDARTKRQEKIQTQRKDWVKAILAVILVVVGVYAYYAVVGSLPTYVASLFPIIGVVLALIIVFFWTSKGRSLTGYVKDSIIELKKVVWPERNETVRTTAYVLLFVFILALVIWIADSLISYLFYDLLMKRG